MNISYIPRNLVINIEKDDAPDPLNLFAREQTNKSIIA